MDYKVNYKRIMGEIKIPTSREFQIAVVGGGATGIAAAISAAELGFKTVLFAPDTPAHPARTAALFGQSVGLLTEIGAWNELRDNAVPLAAIRLVDGTRRLIRAPETMFRSQEIGLNQFGFNVSNNSLVAGLLAVAHTTDNLTKVTDAVRRICNDGAKMTLISAQEIAYSAQLIIGADGRNSIVAKNSGIEFRSWDYPQSALVAILHAQHPHRFISTEFHYERGPFTLVPYTNNKVSLVWVDDPKTLAEAKDVSASKFGQIAENRSMSILGVMQPVSDCGVFPLSATMPMAVSAHRVALIGEAAHSFPPIGAQGLNLGFRDVRAISRFIRRNPSDPGSPLVLHAFERERMPDVRSRLYGVDLLNRTLLSDMLPMQIARGTALSLAGQIPALRRAMMHRGMAGMPS